MGIESARGEVCEDGSGELAGAGAQAAVIAGEDECFKKTQEGFGGGAKGINDERGERLWGGDGVCV